MAAGARRLTPNGRALPARLCSTSPAAARAPAAQRVPAGLRVRLPRSRLGGDQRRDQRGVQPAHAARRHHVAPALLVPARGDVPAVVLHVPDPRARSPRSMRFGVLGLQCARVPAVAPSPGGRALRRRLRARAARRVAPARRDGRGRRRLHARRVVREARARGAQSARLRARGRAHARRRGELAAAVVYRPGPISAYPTSLWLKVGYAAFVALVTTPLVRVRGDVHRRPRAGGGRARRTRRK